MIGPYSTGRGLRADWDLGGVPRLRLLTLLVAAKALRSDAHAEASARDRDCARLREDPKGYYVVGNPHEALGDALTLVRHLTRQIARINERLAALEGHAK